MRTLRLAGLAGAGLVVILAAEGCQPPGATSGSAALAPTKYDTSAAGVITMGPIGLSVSCATDDVAFALRPWRGKASRNTTVRFRVVGDISSVVLSARDAASWPFTEAMPQTVRQGSALTLKPDTGTYKYDVTFDCGTNGGQISIDPDIIITMS